MGEKEDRSSAATEVLGARESPARQGSLAPGSRIDGYVVRRLLGEGGMGQVYLADQLHPVQREVALKLLPEHLTSPMARAYFEVERQALAQMQHAAIAQVFDAGTSDDGQAYIVMEWVDGQPITRYCVERKLGLEARLRLFQRVCHGVQHAHQKGVIHRDLKPDNVLVREVDGMAQPTIIDFGIAVGSDGSTGGERERAGTVTYMSPEQAGAETGNIDTRSDVYSLGVMLFEVLTDNDASSLTTHPFQSGADVRTTLLHVDRMGPDRDDAHAALLQAAARLPAELRAVLRKALQPERSLRYDSAAALGDDLENYLQRRPLQAMPQTRSYQARKFISRHRLGIVASMLVAVALVAGTVLALQGQRRAVAAAQKARSETAKAEKVSSFISAILSGVDPDFAKGRDTSLMRAVLDRAAEKASSELAGEPDVRSSIEHTIAAAYGALGFYKKAVEHDRDAIEAARKAELPLVKQAQLQMALGLDRAYAGDSPQDFLKEVAAAEKLIVGVPPDNLARLTVEHDIAGLRWKSGQLEQALKLMRSVLARERKRLPADSIELADSESMLATIYSDMGDYKAAEPLLKTLLDRSTKLHGEASSSSIDSANELAICYSRQKHFAEAEKLLRHYLPIATRLFGADHPVRMRLFSNLGGAIRQQGRNKEARPYYEHTLEWSLKTNGPDAVQSVFGQTNLAFLLRDTGQLAQAEQHVRQAIAHMDAALGKDNGARGQLPDLLGTILTREKKYPEAAAALDRAWDIYTRSSGYGPVHPLAQDTVQHEIELYQAWGKPAKVKLWQARLHKAEESDRNG
ncbi:MAG: serine/threonine-protein kinase [Rhodanobacteraceae bacterium]